VPIEVDFVNIISNLSLNKWGINAFNDLANNGASLGDILPNAMILLGMAAVYFLIALWRFSRKAEV
jgi:ABC-type multidrug transport system permease subunit